MKAPHLVYFCIYFNHFKYIDYFLIITSFSLDLEVPVYCANPLNPDL